MNSAYQHDVPQHMGPPSHGSYQQQSHPHSHHLPPPQPPPATTHSMPPPGAPVDPYQQQHPPPPHLPPHHPLDHHHVQHRHHQHPHTLPPTLPPPHPHHRQHSTSQATDGIESVRHLPPVNVPQNQQQPPIVSRVEEGSRRSLDVVQQPERARMCGFGDKDRRPITPPPCVRLVITDASTGEEVKCKDIDYSMFVLQVDLWDEHGLHEINLCRNSSSNTAPATSAASGASYAYPPMNGGESAGMHYPPQALPPSRDVAYPQHQPVGYVHDYQAPPPPAYAQASPSYPPNGTYGPPQQYFPAHQSMPAPRYDSVVGGYVDGPSTPASHVNEHKTPWSRNLIGSVAASAFCLNDTKKQEGIWFVLQDLSVRLEGKYKLRFSFVNVSQPGHGTRDRPSTVLNTGRAPILAACFSNSFQVFSAKKFPGVCESTPLSKTFAGQGIKIPIRKDGGKGGDDDDD